ncbi:EF-hand domain-containing family member C2-like [Daphnia pulicaria]|uniref:EF-hand domain-containing family member C2-like n=1 Tax=Daphnia pulicaria TaxID=35523 RepID=UPI001EEAEF97|nr:EF-hand domain-containing family member C2-like [Daphnia pulicaria]
MLPGIGQKTIKSNYRKCQTLHFHDGVPLPKASGSSSSTSSSSGNFIPSPEDDYDYDLHRFRPPQLVAARSAVHFERDSKHMDRELAGLSPPIYPPYKADASRPFIPKTVLYDRLTLRFDGFYFEDSLAWGYSRRAVHPVKLCYYLEDDTISVHEPVTPNSGRPQGKLVRRHKVFKSGHETKDEDGRGGRDDESPDKYWHWKDLNVASDVDIFGRRFRLTNCNQWTREFLMSAGIQVNAPEDVPESHPPLKNKNDAAAAASRSRSAPQRRNHPLKKFLEHDGQILRFGCVWDRRGEENVGLDERLKPYVMRYFLVDDTIQITDAEFESNQKRGLYSSNRAQEAVLLRRQRLPKEPRPIMTSPADAADITFYDPQDLMLANVISVHGRRFVLVETGDDFTRSFYRNHFDVVDFTPVQLD